MNRVSHEECHVKMGILVLVLVIFVIVSLCFGGCCIDLQDSKDTLKRQAIEYNYAHYNSSTGVWEWMADYEKSLGDVQK